MTEYLSLEEKIASLRSLGDDSMIEVFKDWSPARYNYRKKSAPLDQRISLNVTAQDRESFLQELTALKEAGEKVSMSQYIREKATGNIDLGLWRSKAEEALKEISYVRHHLKELKQEKKSIQYDLDNSEDETDDETIQLRIRLAEIDGHLKILKSNVERKPIRLAGRTTFAEREIIVWRAQRLSLNISDYLRFTLFNYLPNSDGDKHLPLDGRQRFYISVLEVADNGFGQPPSAATCSNCVNYLEELARLREEVRILRQYS